MDRLGRIPVGAPRDAPPWHGSRSHADELLWLGWRYGYRDFLKVRCCPRWSSSGGPAILEPVLSGRYEPLTEPAAPFEPIGLDLAAFDTHVQDLLLMDAADAQAVATVQRLSDEECYRYEKAASAGQAPSAKS